MITTNLTGNLGNQISQYITTRCVAEKLGYEWGINPKPSHDYYKGMIQMDFMNVDYGKPVAGITNEYHETWIDYEQSNICSFDSKIYDIKDNTILLGHNGAFGGVYQSERYFGYRRSDILKWLEIKAECKAQYELILKDKNIRLDENLCVINFRGGEYRSMPHVIVRKEYWRDSINEMLLINPKMKFLLITDDPHTANEFMPFPIEALHVSIGFDYYVVNQAKWLIIANSSFSLWASYLNENAKIIAPKYWARCNYSNGHWSVGDQYYSRFYYMNRDGIVEDYDTVKAQAEYFYKLNNLPVN